MHEKNRASAFSGIREISFKAVGGKHVTDDICVTVSCMVTLESYVVLDPFAFTSTNLSL